MNFYWFIIILIVIIGVCFEVWCDMQLKLAELNKDKKENK